MFFIAIDVRDEFGATCMLSGKEPRTRPCDCLRNFWFDETLGRLKPFEHVHFEQIYMCKT